MKKILSLSIEIEALKIVPLKLPGILPDIWKMGGVYRKKKSNCFCNVVNCSMVELYGNIPICSGSQEVIGSIPICSTLIIKGLQSIRLATLSFCAHKCTHNPLEKT